MLNPATAAPDMSRRVTAARSVVVDPAVTRSGIAPVDTAITRVGTTTDGIAVDTIIKDAIIISGTGIMAAGGIARTHRRSARDHPSIRQ